MRCHGLEPYRPTDVHGLVGLAVFGALAAYFFTRASYLCDQSLGGRVPISFFMGTGPLAFILAVLAAYVTLFLGSFVAPLMYKNRISAVKAWRIFLSLFGQYPLQFLGYGLIVLLLIAVFAGLVVAAGLVTCCIGFFLLIIPYVGTVATLPFWYTLRAYSLEFLAQFGPEHNLFPPKAPEAPPAPPAEQAPAPVAPDA